MGFFCRSRIALFDQVIIRLLESCRHFLWSQPKNRGLKGTGWTVARALYSTAVDTEIQPREAVENSGGRWHVTTTRAASLQ